MSYNILTIPPFDRQLKRLVKKYPSLKEEFISLLEKLENEPEQGTPLGFNCFKIRLAIHSKGKGKRGGARVITYIVLEKTSLYLLSIYDKTEKSTLNDKELVELLSKIEEG